MARGITISLTISKPASEMIDTLLTTGLYGRTRAEVAQRLLYAELHHQLERDGALRLPLPKSPKR